jgi:hypothetical protein
MPLSYAGYVPANFWHSGSPVDTTGLSVKSCQNSLPETTCLYLTVKVDATVRIIRENHAGDIAADLKNQFFIKGGNRDAKAI